MKGNQIYKYANNQRLLDCVDQLTTVFKSGGEMNQKIQINICEYAVKTPHPLKQAAFFWDLPTALTLSHDILTDLFPNQTYSKKASFVSYGGGTMKIDGQATLVSRAFKIDYLADKSVYQFTVAIAEGKKGANGQITPVKTIDAHSIQMSKLEARKMAGMIHAVIQAKMPLLLDGLKTKEPEPAPTAEESPSEESSFGAADFAEFFQ